MSNSDHAFSGSLYIISFIVGGIGLISGMLFLISGSDVGVILIINSIIGAIIIFALGKVVQMLHESGTKVVTVHQPELVDPEVEGNRETSELDHDMNASETRIEKWKLNEEEERNITEFYERNNKKVEEIIVTPYPKYCVIKSEDFIDVIEVQDNKPKMLTRDEVESFEELLSWIEEKVFQS